MMELIKKIYNSMFGCKHELKISKLVYLDFNPRFINGYSYDLYQYKEHSMCNKCGEQQINIRTLGTTRYYSEEMFNKHIEDIILSNKYI